MRPLVKIALWLAGYNLLIAGFIMTIAVIKLLLEVAPEVFMIQGLGAALMVAGFWLLGQHNKLSKGRSIWQ